MGNPELLIFDVNETMLDMSPLKTAITKVMENEFAFDIWFPTLLHYSLVETITGNYNNFSDIALAALNMTAGKLNKEIEEDRLKEILTKVKELPAYPDVSKTLPKLKAAGFKMVALTNGKSDVVEAQLKFAKIDHFFVEIISVDEVKAYKPAAETYNYVLRKMEVSASGAMMVAAHGWDLVGAHRAGLQTAFIQRPGKSQYPLALRADHSCRDFEELWNLLSQS